ncbi:MAG: bifunctional diaminohydroxyphosphoribosylaminopyrimidine deaminase/5-amino-6-(5-phosphoribosylamino)uracil reductase RibD [Sphingobacteriales bacterium]|nr:MAG: bifunctional diaminohydroxyphosphoribosylaminopyrimidine deaminase/5-amino-6-(5-phosphoribosylamino)uracil reductase RibD [Sphingobacteriales bacterium]
MQDALYMQRCFELAQKGKGCAAPNPMVGAVLVHNSRIIGEGWHQQYGQAHAEVNCFDSVADADRHLIPESTMYVSLEPCAHYGKTPPCANRIIAEGVKKVVICNIDPFAKVSGRGIDMLKENGVNVRPGIEKEKGLWLNRRFYCFHEQKRPYIILKWAQSVNGFFAPLNRTRYQLSNVHSKQLLHKWRTEEAAIMVGYNTALNDDPHLTARDWKGKQPLRIVIDEDLQLADTLNVFNTEADTWILNKKKTATKGNLQYVHLNFAENILPQLMQQLHEANITSLIVEGGVHLLESFVAAGLWDEARIFTADVTMEEGLKAPLLPNAEKAFTTNIAGDELNVFVHTNSKYPYVAGMEL